MTKDIANYLFYYNKEDGTLHWKNPKSNRLKVGDLAGTLENRDGTGYFTVNTEYGRYKNHIIIWMMHNDIVPEGFLVDHENRIRTDNHIENLRLSTKSLNALNVEKEYKGISYDRARGKWRAQLSINSKNVNLGRFNSEQDAIAAYQEACEYRNELELAKLEKLKI